MPVNNSIACGLLRRIARYVGILVDTTENILFLWKMVLLEYLHLNESNVMLTFQFYHFAAILQAPGK